MPKVIVYPNPIYNPIGVRTLLGEVGVTGPMLQDETSIKCVMTEDQIARFRNSRGAAHKLEIVPDAPPPAPAPEPQAAAPGPVAVPDPVVIDPEILSDDEPRPKDPAIQDAEDDGPNAGGSDSGNDSDPGPKRAA